MSSFELQDNGYVIARCSDFETMKLLQYFIYEHDKSQPCPEIKEIKNE